MGVFSGNKTGFVRPGHILCCTGPSNKIYIIRPGLAMLHEVARISNQTSFVAALVGKSAMVHRP